ncbi:MAG: Slp family lipoprotein [Nitrospira sp.]
MRTLGLFIISVWLVGCTTPPMFPPEIMKDVETDTSVFKAWKEQATHASHAPFIAHKVELEGQILKVIPKETGVILLVDGRAIDQHPSSTSKDSQREDSFRFAIDIDGMLGPGMVQPGNQLVVVGTTDQAGPETVGWVPEVLPHLRAQCLHILTTQGLQNMYFASSGYMGFYAPKERTVCRDENTGSSLATGDSHCEGKGPQVHDAQTGRGNLNLC